MLIKHADDNPTDWPDRLNYVLLAYRTSIHSSTKFSPFELMFGRRFNQFDSWLDIDQHNYEQSLINRSVEIKRLFENKHEVAQENIVKAQEKQVKTQNSQSNASHDILKIGDTVYTKNCSLVKGKFDPNYNGTFKIIDRISSSGNNVIEDENRNALPDSFPRWKLKPVNNSIEAKIGNVSREDQVQKYDVLDEQKIGRGYRYEIKYKNGKIRWIAGKEVDPEAVAKFKRNRETKKHKKTNNFFTSFLFLLIFFVKITGGTKVVGKFNYCQTSEISRVVDLNKNCKNIREISSKNSSFTFFDSTLQFPSPIFIVSKNKYAINEIGYQCFKVKRTIMNNQTWYFHTSRQEILETVTLTRMECLTMVESKIGNNNKMSCVGDICSYKLKNQETFSWNYDKITESFECTFHKKHIISEKDDSALFFAPLNNCHVKDLFCSLYDSVIV